MPAYYDADISGQGQAGLAGGTNVLYLVYHGLTIPDDARELEAMTFDHLLRSGWVSLGRELSVIGATARPYWADPIWLNYRDFRWTPAPNNGGGGSFSYSASHVRWYVPPGGSGRLYVFGA